MDTRLVRSSDFDKHLVPVLEWPRQSTRIGVVRALPLAIFVWVRPMVFSRERVSGTEHFSKANRIRVKKESQRQDSTDTGQSYLYHPTDGPYIHSMESSLCQATQPSGYYIRKTDERSKVHWVQCALARFGGRTVPRGSGDQDVAVSNCLKWYMRVRQ
jgi:hypothetical protein